MVRNQVFISYSRDDSRHLDDFLEILSPFLKVNARLWTDRMIAPGALWLDEIKHALGSAKIAVMLVTPGFLASGFIKEVEFSEILRAQEKQGLIVFWIPVSYSGYTQTVLRHFQSAWDPAKALDDMRPSKRRKVWVKIAEKLMATAEVIEQTDLPEKPRIVVLHRAGTEPDESVLKVLEGGLTAKGYGVFTQRGNSFEVLNQLDNHLTRADAVLPLISPKSDSSEILEMNFQMAREKSEKQNGRPQLVALFLQYDGQPAGIAQACRSLNRVVWRGPQDDATLVERLIRVLNGGKDSVPENGESQEGGGSPPTGGGTPPPFPELQLLSVGGAVPQGDPCYVVRDSDGKLDQALRRGDSIIRIQGARQMGKTSLLLRGLRQARETGTRIVSMDFQAFNKSQFQSHHTFYQNLAETLVEELGLDGVSPKALWKPASSANRNLERVLKRHILPSIEGRLVWAMDEVERLYQFDLSDDFFGLIRSWHNNRALPKGLIWKRLTVIISHATESHVFMPSIIRNPNASPFNVATSLTLDDFTSDQVKDLNTRLGGPLKEPAQVDELYELLGGQPFLVRRALESLKAGETLAHFLERAGKETGPFADHLRRILQVLALNTALQHAVEAFLADGTPLSAEEFYRLRTAGIFAGDSPGNARPRCRLYKDFLKRNLLPRQLRQGA